MEIDIFAPSTVLAIPHIFSWAFSYRRTISSNKMSNRKSKLSTISGFHAKIAYRHNNLNTLVGIEDNYEYIAVGEVKTEQREK
jgi:hypothetical protein